MVLADKDIIVAMDRGVVILIGVFSRVALGVSLCTSVSIAPTLILLPSCTARSRSISSFTSFLAGILVYSAYEQV